MKRHTFLAALLVLGAGNGAFAQDLTPPDVSEMPAQTWSGFYLGAQGGFAWADVDWDNVSLTGEQFSFDPEGFLGGGHGGAQIQFHRLVFGVEGSVSGADLEDTVTSAVNPAVTYTTEIDVLATVAGRIGVAFNSVMPYVKGGYAGGNVRTSGLNAGFDSFSITDWENGWTAGGGIEIRRRNFIFGAEYDFVDLGDFDRNGTTDIALFPFTITDIDTGIHSVSGRVSYLFGGAAP
jgi:outer membrane immunogenic protein